MRYGSGEMMREERIEWEMREMECESENKLDNEECSRAIMR